MERVQQERSPEHGGSRGGGEYHRPRVVQRIRRILYQTPVVWVQGRAGQGKSTAVRQFIATEQTPSVWYPVSEFPGSSIGLVRDLYRRVVDALQRDPDPELRVLLAKEGIPETAAPPLLERVLRAARASAFETLFLVIDDLHWLPQDHAVSDLLKLLAEQVEHPLYLILVSRSLPGEELGIPSTSLLTGEELAFTAEETEGLFSQNGAELACPAEEICRGLEGWPMGIALWLRTFGRDAGRITGNDATRWFAISDRSVMARELQQRYLQTLPRELRDALLRLSLFPTFDTEMLRSLLPAGARRLLRRHIDSGQGFVVSTGDECRFQHLLRHVLNSVAEHELDEVERRELLTTGGDHAERRGDTVLAIRLYQQGGKWKKAERLLRRIGFDLVATRRDRELEMLLAGFPADYWKASPWLRMLLALLIETREPARATRLLESTLERLQGVGNVASRLVCLILLLQHYGAVTAEYGKGLPVFEEADLLFRRLRLLLPRRLRILTLTFLAGAAIFLKGDGDYARERLHRARRLAEEDTSDDTRALILFFEIYAHLVNGQLRAALPYVEQAHRLATSPLLQPVRKSMLWGTMLNWHNLNCDTASYRELYGRFRELATIEEVEQTTISAYSYRWMAQCLIRDLELEEARDVLHQALALTGTGASDHLRSQFHQYQACIEALEGNVDACRRHAERAWALRLRVGEVNQIAYAASALAFAWYHAGDLEQARAFADRCIDSAKTYDKGHIEATGWLIRSLVAARTGAEQDLADSLVRWIAVMLENDGCIMDMFTRPMLRDALVLALERDVPVESLLPVAQRYLDSTIAGTRLIPRLHLGLAHELSLEVAGNRLEAEDFTPQMRCVLLLLATSRRQRLALSEIIEELYRDREEGKSPRAALDTLLTRLRRLLGQRLGIEPKDYLVTRNGYLLLENTVIDLDERETLCRRMADMARQGQCWQAENLARQLGRMEEAAWEWMERSELQPVRGRWQSYHRVRERAEMSEECKKP